jgi:aminoglycoside phosphotransferase (APT) family kinase protein
MDDLTALLARAVGCSPPHVRVTLRPALEHQSNRLYDGWVGQRHLILKEYLKPAEFQTAPAREFRALNLLAPLDVAPQPGWFEPEHPPERGPVVIYEFMEGTMWDRRRPSAADLAALAALWLKIHAIPDEPPGTLTVSDRPLVVAHAAMRTRLLAFAAWVDAEFPGGRQAADLCLRVLEQGQTIVRDLADLEPVLRFCRSDARFANVIARPDGRLGLVDWEDSGLRDPAREISDLMSTPNQEDLLSPDQWQAFLQPYLAALSASDPGLRERTRLYLGRHPVFWLSVLTMTGVHRANAGTLAGWTINELPANLRLRRYLARALAWPDGDVAAHLDALADVRFFPDC